MAIEIVDLPLKVVVFHSYVSLPEGKVKQTTPSAKKSVKSVAERKLHLNLAQTRQSDALGSELTMALAGLRQLDAW